MKQRKFALAADTTPGGTPFDDLASGAVPAPTEAWDVTNVSLERNPQNIDYDDEVTGFPGTAPPEAFTVRPVVTVAMRSRFRQLVRALYWCHGTAATREGAAPAALEDTVRPRGQGAAGHYPARHMEIARDDVVHRLAGGVVRQVELTLPRDGDGTCTLQIPALYAVMMPDGTSAATPVTPDPGRTLKLKRAALVINDNAQEVDGVTSIGLTLNNGLRDAEHWANRNIVADPANPNNELWFPQEHPEGTARTITGNYTIRGTDVDRELAQEFARAEALEIELAGALMGTTPAAREGIVFRIPKHVRTGGAEALTRADDINSVFQFTGHWDRSAGYDIETQFVHNQTGLLTP